MITRYVNTASSAGGDGTTNSTSGSNRAYASMSEAATQLASLNASEDIQVLCCGSAADTLAANWTGNYVQGGFSVTVKGNPDDINGDHCGIKDETKYRLTNNLSLNSSCIFEIDTIQSVVSSTTLPLNVSNATQISSGSVIRNCLFISSGSASGIIIYNNSGQTFDIQNCVVFFGGGGANGIDIVNNNATVRVYNSLVRGFGDRGIWNRGSATVAVKNSMSFGNDDDFVGTFSTVDHCASDDGDGSNPLTGLTWSNEFIDPSYSTTVDLRPRKESKLLRSGADTLSDSNLPSTDILGKERLWHTPAIGPFGFGYDAPKTVRYVNTASTTGGDGTTNATTGSNRAFPNLLSAEIALRNSAFSSDLEILCCGIVADSSTVTFNENSYNYVQDGYTLAIRANRSDTTGYHGGKWNNYTYRISTTGQTRFLCYRNVIIDGIQIQNTFSGALASVFDGYRSYGQAIIKNCIFKAQSAVGSYDVVAYNNSGTFSYLLENCIIAGQNSVDKSWGGLYTVGSMYSAKVYNCVFSANITGITNLNNSVVKNCSFHNVNTVYTSGTSSTFDHNATTSGTGDNPITISNWDDEFRNSSYASDLDFNLKPSSSLIRAGVGPGVDVDVYVENMRSSSRYGYLCDVGPFEYSNFKWGSFFAGPSTQSSL